VPSEPYPNPSRTSSEEKIIRVRYSGVCAVCGLKLERGVQAAYNASTRRLCCLGCTATPQANQGVEVEVAGASARAEYERRRSAREHRVKQRLGRIVGSVVLALSDEPATTRAWARGSKGEAKLAAALSDVPHVRALHDRSVPGTRGNIDHIVIGPGGVFVVDAKRYQGLIRIRDIGGFFKRADRLYVGHRDCSRLATNMAWQVEAISRALSAGHVDPAPPVTPVLCFVEGEWPLISPPTLFEGVRIEGTRSIKKLVTTPQLLEPAMIERLVAILAAHLPPKLASSGAL